MKVHIPIAGLKRKVLIGSIVALPILGAGGVAYAATTTPSPTVTHPAANTSQSANDTAGTNDPAEAPDTAGAHESDGPGGHQDPNGVNVDHQFDGQE